MHTLDFDGALCRRCYLCRSFHRYKRSWRYEINRYSGGYSIRGKFFDWISLRTAVDSWQRDEKWQTLSLNGFYVTSLQYLHELP